MWFPLSYAFCCSLFETGEFSDKQCEKLDAIRKEERKGIKSAKTLINIYNILH